MYLEVQITTNSMGDKYCGHLQNGRWTSTKLPNKLQTADGKTIEKWITEKIGRSKIMQTATIIISRLDLSA